MLAPGRDTGRWKVKQGAEIIGYVFAVKVGGIESTNCHARAAEQRDTHIELFSTHGWPYPARSRDYTPLAGDHGCSRDGLVNAGIARQAAGALTGKLEAGCWSTWNTRMRPEWLTWSRAQLESDGLGNSPDYIHRGRAATCEIA